MTRALALTAAAFMLWLSAGALEKAGHDASAAEQIMRF